MARSNRENAQTTESQNRYRNGQLLITAEAGSGSMPTSGLVGYWKFDENSGTTAADSSGNGNTGTLQSGPSWATGHSNSAINFDGVDDYVKIKNGKISSATAGTISAWVKLSSLINAAKIVSYGGASAASVQGLLGLEVRQDGSNYYFSVISVPYDGCGFVNSAHGSTVLQAGAWYHLALTSNGSSWQLYVNGVAETMTTQYGSGNTGRWFGNTTAASPDKTYIGATRFNGTDSSSLNGLIDEVRIYDRALSGSEIIALAGNGGNGAANINWLVTDQLGTPRMIFDQTGSLANVKRHDYLPFGEELSSGVGLRSSTMGYSQADGVRQKFTDKERDVETGLDYFGARYYASMQGRFTGADPYDINFERQETADPEEANVLFTEYIGQPQHWDHYSYALNNPLKYVDPDGLYEKDMELLGQKVKVHIDDEIIKKDKDALKRILDNLQKAFDKIEAGAAGLLPEQIESIHSQNHINVSNYNPNATVGDTFLITQRTAENPNIDKLAGDIIHDSRHSEQFNRGLSYNEKTYLPMEMEASQFAGEAMDKIGGFNPEIRNGFEDDAKNGHFPRGYKGPDKSTPNSRAKVFETMKKPQKHRN
jgi:RHS repeat-associated protein